jgi:glycosyltransferase involved in cell wall biosynthesis
MRVLFYVGEKSWSGSSRAVLAGASALVSRGHTVALACCGGTRLDSEARVAEIETIEVSAASTAAGGAWDLRKVLKDRFIEVVIVTSERDQLIVSSARMFADRGAVLRRIASFEELDVQRSGKLALRMAASGLIVSTADEARALDGAGWTLPTTVVPLGIDTSAFDDVEPAARHALGAPNEGVLIACNYDESGRYRIATIFRTLALLAPRNPNMHVVVFGPGSLDEGLRMHASALGVGSLVSFVGETTEDRALMRAATAGWVVSGADNAAYGCLDFMALRIPVIADRTPLTQHYVADGITGALLAPGDPAYTASNLASFFASREKLAAMGNAARARVQRNFPDAISVDAFDQAVHAAGDRTTWAKR